MFEGMTYQMILKRMLSRVSDEFDKREGSVIWDTHSPTALEFQFLYIELERIILEAYGETASREFLLLRCKERGIEPYEATNAVLRGEFYPANIDVTGKRFNIGTINFVAAQKEQDGVYQMICETAGNIGNQQLGTMLPIDYIEGLESAKLTKVLIPGEDEEDTEALRKRYFNSFKEKEFGGNVQDYIKKTNSISGVGGVKVTRVWNGDIRPADMIPSQKVNEWRERIKGTLDPEVEKWLSAVYEAAKEKKLTVGGTALLTIINSDYAPASDELIKSVQEAIDPNENAGEGYGLAPIGHVVCIKSAAGVLVNVKADIEFSAGYGWNNLQNSIDAIISDYLLELRKEWSDSDCLAVRISQIEARLLAIAGIVDIKDTRINGNADNLTLGQYDIPIFGGAGEL